jgi:hypothetical protein
MLPSIRIGFLAAALASAVVTTLGQAAEAQISPDVVAWQNKMQGGKIPEVAPYFFAGPLCPGCSSAAFYCSAPIQTLSDLKGRRVIATGEDFRKQLTAAGAVPHAVPEFVIVDALKGKIVDCVGVLSAASTSTSPVQSADIDVVRKFGLLGKWAQNCRTDVGFNVFGETSAGTPEYYIVIQGQRRPSATMTNVRLIPPDSIRYEIPPDVVVTLKKIGSRIQFFESSYKGKPTQQNGRIVQTGAVMPTLEKCD